MAEARRDLNRVTTILATSSSDDTTPVNVHVDSTTKRLLTDSTIEEYGHSTVGDGTKTVTTAGTRVQLSETSVLCKRVYIEAHESNAGEIVVGGSTVVAAVESRRGLTLRATQGDWFKVSNLNILYIDSTVSGDKVNFYYET